MSPSAIPEPHRGGKTPHAAITRMSYWATAAGWDLIATELTANPLRLEQEALDPRLPD